MTEVTFSPSALSASGDITLVLAQRTTKLKGFRVAMHTDVEAELRRICEETLAALAQRTAVPYSDDLSFDPESQYLVAEPGQLVAHELAPRRGRPKSEEEAERPMVEMDPQALRVLSDASSLDQMDAADLGKRSFLFYAAVVGDDPAARTSFLSQWNPYKAALSGRLLASFGDRLRRVEGPLLAFEPAFDMVVTASAVAVLRAAAFEKVFRDIDSMKARVPVWGDAVAQALPLDDASAEVIKQACEKGVRVARQARSLFERGVLEVRFETPSLETEMRRQGLEADRLIQDGKLVLQEDDVFDVLKLIDEKLYRGWHTDTAWDVGTRAKRTL